MNKLHILHTNDIHSHFHQMPFIASGIRSLRRQYENNGDQVVTVDLGDHMDRMSPVTEATWGQANIEVMNKTGYNLAAIGNNEGLTFPKQQLGELYRNAQFEVICHNLIDRTTRKIPDFIKPYVIREYNGLRIGWISVTAPFHTFYHLLGWQILDPFEQVKVALDQLRSHTDLIIILSHLGYKQDQLLAQQFPEIQVILGAHTHHLLMAGEKINQTFIIQAGKFGQYIGRTTIEYDPRTRQVGAIYGSCYESQYFGIDREIQEVIDRRSLQSDHILSPSVVHLQELYAIDWKMESPLGNLLAEGIRNWVEADISMVNAGQILFSLPPGPVSKKDLLTVCPHPINPCRLKLKGKAIQQILEQSLMESNISREIRGFGFRGKVLGWMCVDGMEITYDPSGVEGQRICKITINGNPLQAEKVYTVGTIDMFTFSWVYPLFREDPQVEYFLPEFIRDVLEKELQSDNAMHSSSKKRWISL
ncbi:MAG TPA: bifunctional UDP-sugar hydrolase/5'-nucleotidase [Bacillota bacterium]|nr:bifunctional UDP-sugar hydrolase/5'-nucleotidase [Bacillota bacterium]